MSFIRRARGRYASVSTRKPLARSEDLVIENLDDEVLIYDGNNARAHSLGATAARVWRACDGETGIDDLAAALELPRETVLKALGELEGAELLESFGLQIVNGESGNGNGLTRREMGLRTAKIGAAAVAAPMLYSIAVPSAAAAATPTNAACALYSSDSCGQSKGACAVLGCCCCCQGGGNCKLGGSVTGCSSLTGCGGTTAPNCACSCTTPSKCVDATSSGCCSVPGSSGCGCAFAGGDSTQQGCPCNDTSGGCVHNSQNGCTANCTPGGSGCGSGCCNISTATTTGGPNTCTEVLNPDGTFSLVNCPACSPPSSSGTATAGCVPCCNGSPLSQTVSSPPFNCCTPGATIATTTCPPALCERVGTQIVCNFT